MAGLASLGSAINGGFGERRTSALLAEVDGEGNIILESEASEDKVGPIAFQYFPETLTDTKAVNYQRKDIPGASLPIYQWVSSGERAISFQAVFTTDTDIADSRGQNDENQEARQKQQGVLDRNVDIRSALAWLRRFTLPMYASEQGAGSELGVPLSKAPPRALLVLKNSGIGLRGGNAASHSKFDSQDSMLCLMTQCDVTDEAYFPNGVPRISTVSLTFVEIGQLNGLVSFPGRSEFMAQSILGQSGRYRGYRTVSRPDTDEDGTFIG